MDKNTHKLIVVSYELYSVENGEEIFVEKTDEQKPLQFYTGCDMALPAFEKAVKELNTDSEFDFNLSPEEAYGNLTRKVCSTSTRPSSHIKEFSTRPMCLLTPCCLYRMRKVTDLSAVY